MDSPPGSPPDSPVLAPQQPRPHDKLPWIEKYRPKKLEDVAHQDEVVQTLRRTLQSGNLPHLLFYGPPGTGKTSTIMAMARELYGPELMKKRVLELNASNERGIDVIRQFKHPRNSTRRCPCLILVGCHKVKEFAQIAVGSRDSVAGYPCPPFKIIILDEADSMTKDAQSALRRTMEQYTKVTRFAIICNYVSRIIEPITSRCAKFRYKSLNSDSMIGRLRTIADAEHLTLQDDTLNKLVELSEGDMRRSITILQSAQKLRGMKNQLRPEDVMEVAGVIPPERIVALVTACKGGTFRHIQSAAQEMIYSAYPVDQILAQLLTVVMADDTIGDVAKAKVAVRLAENEHKLIEGADEYLQLLDVLSYTAQSITATL